MRKSDAKSRRWPTPLGLVQFQDPVGSSSSARAKPISKATALRARTSAHARDRVRSPRRKNIARKFRWSEECLVCGVQTEGRQERFAAQAADIIESRGDGLAKHCNRGIGQALAKPDALACTQAQGQSFHRSEHPGIFQSNFEQQACIFAGGREQQRSPMCRVFQLAPRFEHFRKLPPHDDEKSSCVHGAR